MSVSIPLALVHGAMKAWRRKISDTRCTRPEMNGTLRVMPAPCTAFEYREKSLVDRRLPRIACAQGGGIDVEIRVPLTDSESGDRSEFCPDLRAAALKPTTPDGLVVGARAICREHRSAGDHR